MTDIDLDLGWQDVLRRARRGRTRRLVVATVAVAAMLSAGSALAVLLTRPAYATLPPQANRAKAVVVVDPGSGRPLLQVAPLRGRPGVCYVVRRRLAGCTRTAGKHGTVFLMPPQLLLTFDRRVRTIAAARLGTLFVRVPLYRFPHFGVAFALPPNRVCTIKLLDKAGKTLSLVRLGCRR